MPSNASYKIFYFDRWTVTERLRAVEGGSTAVSLRPKCFDMLVLLLRRANQTVPADDIAQALWPGKDIKYGTIPQAISELRDALAGGDMILTIPGIGYQLAARVACRRDDGGHEDIAQTASEVKTLFAEAKAFSHESAGARMYRSIKCFREVLDLRPDFAPAYGGLSSVYALMAVNALEPAAPLVRRATNFARKALELDPSTTSAASALATLDLFFNRKPLEAQLAYKNMQRSDVGIADSYAWCLFIRGELSEGVSVLEDLLNLEPCNRYLQTSLGGMSVFRGDFARAKTLLQGVLDEDPVMDLAKHYIGRALIHEGHYAEGIRQVGAAARGVGRDYLGLVGHAYAQMGQKASAERLVQVISDRSTVPCSELAQVAAGFGETDAALDLLERAENLEPQQAIAVGSDPCFVRLRTSSRFRRLCDRLGTQAS